jgi:RimJ/RimL family protein N-acetyltransferase
MTLRPALIEDAQKLLDWRNEAATRNASHNLGTIGMDEHMAWVTATLKNPDRRLYIAESGDMPFGTVRADFSGGVAELSWTIAPEFRGRGLAKLMVAALAAQITGAIRAEVKETNSASIRVAESAGMSLEKSLDGVLHFKREPKAH